MRSTKKILFAFAFLTAIAVFGPRLETAMAESCATSDCHAGMGEASYVHAPVAEAECDACHEPTAEGHPDSGSMELVEEDPALCLQCHEDPSAGMPFPHTAVQEGCTGCHNPHGGDLPKFVSQSGGELCVECHEVVLEGEYAHGPVKANNCGICHEVHGGQHEAMLSLPGKENCLACHGGIKDIIDNAKSQHEPVVNGLCWDCHSPHTADFDPHLVGPFPEGFYAPFDRKRYELCFECHSETTFTYRLTSEATNFRNHNSNLHSFHVNRMEKGRVCRSCHGVHGAEQGKLLYSRVPNFGQWDIPLQWVVSNNGNGATCFVGCHKPKRYDREEWIRNK